jgi:hypothetical protein
MTARLRRLCGENLARFKVPVRFAVVDDDVQRSERYKKVRRIEEDADVAAVETTQRGE